MKFEHVEAKNLSLVAYHAPTCVKSVCRSNALTRVRWPSRYFRLHASAYMQDRASQLSYMCRGQWASERAPGNVPGGGGAPKYESTSAYRRTKVGALGVRFRSVKKGVIRCGLQKQWDLF